MRREFTVFSLIIVLLMPVYANAQTSDRITILDNFGEYASGEPLFIFGQVAKLSDDSFLIMQIINPQGNLCQIQQLIPLSNGEFLTDVIPLKGRICGLPGEYEIKLFYGNYSTSTKFSVTSDFYTEQTSDELFLKSEQFVSQQISIVDEKLGIGTDFVERLNLAVSNNSLSELEKVYVDLWADFFFDELLFEINPLIRPAISASLDSVVDLLDSNEISFEVAKSIDRKIFSSIFYYEIGDKTKAIDVLSDVFIDVRNVNPEKTTTRAQTFDELEETLLNLMKKSDTVMSRDVKEEVAFIFARGTAPVYASEISELVDLLSKSRYLDIVSRKQSDLYRLVQTNWDSVKPTLSHQKSLEDLLVQKDKVVKLHQASILLRELDNVDRFISSDSEENSELANLILPDWKDLQTTLALASTVDDILDSKNQISQMKQITDISSRINKAVEISQKSNLDSILVDDWKELLEKVESANSFDEILTIVSEFDQSMSELREKRNPLALLKYEYRSMKEKAELQSDYANLYTIHNALQILETAENMEKGTPSVSRIDRIEVLLTWVSQQVPIIKDDLNSYNHDVFKIRASDILQRAKSLENLIEMSYEKKRFLPGYIEFTDSFNEKLDQVRELVIQTDLDFADKMVRDLFAEWRQVSGAYEDDPFGSPNGYSVDEIKRIEYRERLVEYSNAVLNFNHSGFSQYANEFDSLMQNAYELIDYGNFVDTESKIIEIGKFLSDHLVMSNSKIIYDISFDPERDIWIIQGGVDKPIFDRRENLYVTIFNMDGSTHSSLEFTDTRQGNFHTQWEAPTSPGLYVVMLQYQNSKATQIIHVEEEFDSEFTPADLNMVEFARNFEELQTFMERFGGEKYQNNSRFVSVLNDIKIGLANNDAETVSVKLNELKQLIERYLPIRLRSAVIEVTYENDNLIVAGAVEKTLSFREDLFVDIFDQQGSLVHEIALRDNSSGIFNEVISQPFDFGVYVAQLQYHDVIVNDYFSVP